MLPLLSCMLCATTTCIVHVASDGSSSLPPYAPNPISEHVCMKHMRIVCAFVQLREARGGNTIIFERAYELVV